MVGLFSIWKIWEIKIICERLVFVIFFQIDKLKTPIKKVLTVTTLAAVILGFSTLSSTN